MNEKHGSELISPKTANIIRKIVIGLALFCLVLICGVGLLLYLFRDWPHLARKAFSRNEMSELRTLIEARMSKHSPIPVNTNGGFVLHVLDHNETSRLLLDPSRRICHTVTNSEGELLDGWATPYRIGFVDQSNFVIRSAGKNRMFGDKDDIAW